MKPQRAAVLALVLSLAASVPAAAQSRWVIVNGQRLNDAQVASLEQRACTAIPNGQYWLDLQTGAWGYARNAQPQGVIGDACRQPRKSLSERRKLYRPGEILGQ